jgi:hypothetical protein
MSPNELLLWLLFFHLRNKKFRECNKYIYSQKDIRHIFMFEYTKQQNLLYPIFQIKFK